MLISIFVGFFAGCVGAICWALTQLIFGMPELYQQFAGNRYWLPPVLGLIAALLYTIGRPTNKRRQPLVDVFESYHYGVFHARPVEWVVRSLITLLNTFIGGTFGVSGGALELCFAAIPFLSRYMRLFVEQKQTFDMCTIAASLGVVLGTPLTGALIAIELLSALEPKARTGAFLAALVSYGSAILLQATIFSPLFPEGASESANIIGILFSAHKPLNFDQWQWFLISFGAIGVGIIGGVFASYNSRVLARADEFFNNVFGDRVRIGMILTGVLMGVSVWLVPESFAEPRRAWEDIAWLRLSSSQAVALMTAEWVLFVLAFTGFGSTGLFSPVLTLGALLGYAVGNIVDATWALPLSIAGAVAVLARSFKIPMAATVLVLEAGRDGPLWWLATLAVLAATVVSHFLKDRSLQQRLLERRGLHIVNGRAANVLSTLSVSEAMRRDVQTLSDRASLQELRAAIASSNHNFLGVLSMDRKFLGILALEQLPSRIRRSLATGDSSGEVRTMERVIEIRDLIEVHNPSVLPSDSLEKGLAVLDDMPCIAVVDENRFLCGILLESSIIDRYKREISNKLIRES